MWDHSVPKTLVLVMAHEQEPTPKQTRGTLVFDMERGTFLHLIENWFSGEKGRYLSIQHGTCIVPNRQKAQ